MYYKLTQFLPYSLLLNQLKQNVTFIVNPCSATGPWPNLQMLHWVLSVDGGIWLVVSGWVPQVQGPPPQPNLHVPRPPAVLPVLIGCGGVELRVPQVSEKEEGGVKGKEQKQMGCVSVSVSLSHLGTCCT